MPATTHPTASIEQEIAAPTETVWDSLTTDEGFSSWAGEGSHIDARPGGRVDTPDDATGRPRAGAVETVDEHRHLRYRWWPTDEPDLVSIVDITLVPSTAGTHLTVIERLVLPPAPSMRAHACASLRRPAARLLVSA